MMADRVHHGRLPRPAAICSPPTKKPSHTAPPAIKRASNLTKHLAPSAAAAVLSRSFTSLNDDHRAMASSAQHLKDVDMHTLRLKLHATTQGSRGFSSVDDSS